MPDSFFIKLQENHPFISILSYADQEYVGIIQNKDDLVTSMYDYGAITNPSLKEKFLQLGDVWWWESNRMIPINLFLKHEWDEFKQFSRTFNNKNLVILHGPVCSMNDLYKRRSKRRSITLVRRMP